MSMHTNRACGLNRLNTDHCRIVSVPRPPLASIHDSLSEMNTTKSPFVEVGTPVSRCPPHRSRRALLRHRALQINSLSHESERTVCGVDPPPAADRNLILPDKASHYVVVPQCAVAALGTAPASGLGLAMLNCVFDCAGSTTCRVLDRWLNRRS